MTDYLPHPDSTTSYDRAVGSVSELAEAIRVTSRDQAEYWQQLPLLGVMNLGNGGVDLPRDVTLSEQGLLGVDVNNAQFGDFGTYLDCESGELFFLPGNVDDKEPADDKRVIKAWLSHVMLRGYDAREIVVNYKRHVARQRAPKDLDLEAHLKKVTPRRLAIAKQLGLRVSFRRDPSLQGTELDLDTYAAITSVDPSFEART